VTSNNQPVIAAAVQHRKQGWALPTALFSGDNSKEMAGGFFLASKKKQATSNKQQATSNK